MDMTTKSVDDRYSEWIGQVSGETMHGPSHRDAFEAGAQWQRMELRAQNEWLAQQIVELADTLAAVRKDHERALSQRDELLSRLDKQGEDFGRHLTEADFRCAQTQDKLDEIRDENESLKSAYEAMRNVADNRNAEIERLRTELHRVAESRRGQRERAERVEAENERLRLRVNALRNLVIDVGWADLPISTNQVLSLFGEEEPTQYIDSTTNPNT